MIPIGDEPNEHHAPWATYGLIAANVIVFLATGALTPDTPAYERIVRRYGYVPSEPRIDALFTCMFLHGGLMHLLGNMLYLWIFGDNVEARLGRVKHLLAYLATGVAGTLLFAAVHAKGEEPLVGASGAISGVQGVYFLAFPRNRVKLLIFFFYVVDVIRVPARWIIGFWFVINDLFPALFQRHILGDSVAHEAHLGGFGAGILVYLLLKPLLRSDDFEPGRPTPGDRFPGGASPPPGRGGSGGGAGRLGVGDDPYAGGRTSRARWDVLPARSADDLPVASEQETIAAAWRAGRYREASDLFARSLRFGNVPPLRADEFFRLSAHLYETGRFDDARRAFYAFLQTFPGDRNSPAAAFGLGVILARKDRDVPGARRYLEQAFATHPDPKVRDAARRELSLL